MLNKFSLAVLSLMLIGSLPSNAKYLELMSYNVENLFDASHDVGHADYEYLPMNHPAKTEGCAEITNDYFRGKCFRTDWNERVLDKKISSITDVVYRNGKQTPDILGIVEIENIQVANQLKEKLGYSKAIITSGQDQRGINVALLIRESKYLRYDAHHEIEVSVPEMRKPTRNVLHVRFKIPKGKILNVFVNHWPSQNNPSIDRLSVASTLYRYINSKASDPSKHLIAIMGDFNVVKSDSPHSINEVLLRDGSGLVDVEKKFRKNAFHHRRNIPPSSYYYRRGNDWNHLDRIIVSENLFDGKDEEVDLETFDIFAHSKYSKKINGNQVPVRFEIKGDKANGASDHFPVSVKIEL